MTVSIPVITGTPEVRKPNGPNSNSRKINLNMEPQPPRAVLTILDRTATKVNHDTSEHNADWPISLNEKLTFITFRSFSILSLLPGAYSSKPSTNDQGLSGEHG